MPERPDLAPDRPSDVELAGERLRLGGHIVKLENQVRALVRWGNGK